VNTSTPRSDARFEAVARTSRAADSAPRVIGIDVGGSAKGFHAVLLAGSELLERRHDRDPVALAAWCATRHATVVAVDAPCRWRPPPPAPARAAERALAAEGISCYFTPTEARARSHPFYSWMLPGAALFDALRPHYALYDGDATLRPLCIETFPHAVACALAGAPVSAKDKKPLRANLLRLAGMSIDGTETMDELDALLCALAASAFAQGRFRAFGAPADGFIVVPAAP